MEEWRVVQAEQSPWAGFIVPVAAAPQCRSFTPDYFAGMISTRRFRARPGSVALSATGRVGPNPWGVSRPGATPCDASHVITEAARSCDSRWLSSADPWLSVCPEITQCESGFLLTKARTFCRAGVLSGRKVAELTSKCTPYMAAEPL